MGLEYRGYVRHADAGPLHLHVVQLALPVLEFGNQTFSSFLVILV